MIRVVIADDQTLVRGALCALLNLEDDIDVVGDVGRGDELIPALEATAADVAVVDIEMPGLDGIAATQAVRAAGLATKILIVTTFGRPGYLQRALTAGASGFMVKILPPKNSPELSGRSTLVAKSLIRA